MTNNIKIVSDSSCDLLALSGVIAKEVKRFQPTIDAERASKKAAKTR